MNWNVTSRVNAEYPEQPDAGPGIFQWIVYKF